MPKYLEKLNVAVPIANKWQEDCNGYNVVDILNAMGIMIGSQIRNESDIASVLNVISLAALTTIKIGTTVDVGDPQ